MKKLVKTAKQQFEERLNQLTLIKKYNLSETDLYYLCENEYHEMSILREIHDKEFYEQKYTMSYSELISSEDFLHDITMRFIEHHDEPVKPLFDWYASADKDDEPFTLDDIWMCNLEDIDLSENFSDIYEEVPDVRIITAKEQWEKDSNNAKVLCSSTDKTLKVEVSSSWVIFYDSEDIYSRSIYPPLEVMRNDALFVGRMTESMNEASMYDDIAIFLKWVRTGGDFPLPLSVIYHSEYSNYKFEDYEDKEKQPKKIPNCVTEMNMYDPFNWLRESDNGTWNWIAEYCKDHNEYGYLDIYYRIIEGSLVCTENEFCKDMTMEEIKADYAKRFPLLLASVFENLANDIRNGDLQFTMNYNLK